MKTNGILVLAAALAMSGCTAVTVKPVGPSAQMLHVCIQENPKVLVEDFVPVVQAGLERHAISSEIFEGGTPPAHCEYVMTYTALRSWDFAPYLSRAELYINSNGKPVASAIYFLRGSGGFSLMKWAGTKEKMDPVIDRLFAANAK